MSWQIGVLHFFKDIRSPLLNKMFEVITISAESAVLLLVIATVYWCIDKKLGQKLGFTLLFSMVINGFIKNLVKAPRPFELGVIEPLRQQTATGHSFPSGHTQAATTFWLGWMTHVHKKWLYYTGIIIIPLIGLSRVYLGVHWPIDVIAAIGVGIVCSIVGQGLFAKIEGSKTSLLLLGSCIILLATLFLQFDADYVKAVGGATGFIIGHLLESKYISFSTKAPLKRQMKKLAIGTLGLGILYGGLKLILPPYLIFSFMRYLIVALWIVAGAPYVFGRVFKMDDQLIKKVG